MKFPHRNLFLTALLFALLCVPMPAFATLDTLSVTIDDTATEYQAFIDTDESVFMSAADIASVFQAEYTYNSEEDSITYVLGKKLFGKKEAVLTAEANTAMVNGKQIDLDAAPVVSDDLLLVPMEAVSAIWNAAYGFNSEALYIHTDGSEVVVPVLSKVFVEKQSVTIGEKTAVIRYIRIPASSNLKADIVLAHNNIGATEELSDIAVRSSAKAAINGGFFQSFV
mgnify:FL=1